MIELDGHIGYGATHPYSTLGHPEVQALAIIDAVMNNGSKGKLYIYTTRKIYKWLKDKDYKLSYIKRAYKSMTILIPIIDFKNEEDELEFKMRFI